MQIVMKKVDELIPYENNPRNNADAVPYVKESIKQFGFKVPAIIDKNNVIIAGHTRLLAAKELGYTEVPCIVADDLTEEQVKAFRLADNKVAEFAEWDMDKLMEEIADIGDDLNLDDLGFGDLLQDDEEEPHDDDFDADEFVPEEPISKKGDIYQLGDHILMCGDSTSREDVDKLMNDERANFFLSDPPYNVNYDANGTREGIMNDNFATDEEAGEKLWLPSFKNAIDVADDSCSYIIFMPQGGTHMMMMMMMMKAGWQVKHELIWKKQSIVLNRADINYQHEPMLYGWYKKHIFYGKGKYHTTSVWEFDRPTKSKLHPTQKSVDLLGEALLNFSKKDDIVLDLFGGSGSTLIACEQLGRKCRMMELDAKFVDVIIARWEQYTGKKAVKLN